MSTESSPSEYRKDFEFLQEIKDFVICEVRRHRSSAPDEKNLQEIKEGYFTQLPDSRKVRVVFPNGLPKPSDVPDAEKTFSEAEAECRITAGSPNGDDLGNDGVSLCFVGFIGYLNPQGMTEEVNKELWKLDDELMAALSTIPEFLIYVSAEREKAGDWGNLVLFSSMAAVHSWQQFPCHQKAVCEMSPQVYTNVRIHRGVLQNGILSSQFHLIQTIFLDYREGVKRHVTKW